MTDDDTTGGPGDGSLLGYREGGGAGARRPGFHGRGYQPGRLARHRAGRHYVFDLDVSRGISVHTLVEQVTARFGRIDVLVNNAGIGAAGAVEEMSVEQHQRVLDVNVLGVIRMSKAVLPVMRAQGGGRIINVSSVLGLVPQPFMAVYVASKHAVEGFSESLDHEVREHGVRIVRFAPARLFDGQIRKLNRMAG